MSRLSLPGLLAAAGLSALGFAPESACAQTEIRKVNYTDLTFDRPLLTSDPMITFERQRLLHGAITAEDYRERRGRYFTVLWKTEDRSPGLVVRLEFLQANTGAQVHVREFVPESIERKNSTEFRIIGKDFVGEWFWEDGRALTDAELEGHLRALRNGTPVSRRPTPRGGGDVLAWKVSLIRDGVVLDSTRSYLWKD
jgi:hypothetical protein